MLPESFILSLIRAMLAHSALTTSPTSRVATMPHTTEPTQTNGLSKDGG